MERIITIDWLTGKGKPHFFLIAKDGIVVDAPPIARWCMGKEINTVVKWFKNKGAKINEIYEGKG